MPVLSNSIGSLQKQKQGLLPNTGSRAVAQQQQQQAGRKYRTVTRDSKDWHAEFLRVKKQWAGFKVPRELVGIRVFDGTEERAYVVGQFDSKERVTLHSVAELRNYLQRQQQRAAGGGQQRQQEPLQQRPLLQQRQQQQRHHPPTAKERRMRQALGINKPIAKNRLAPVVQPALPATAPPAQPNSPRQQAKPRAQVFKPGDAGWRDRLIEITQQWLAFAKHAGRLEEVKVSVRPNGGMWKTFRADGQKFRTVKDLVKHFADVNNAGRADVVTPAAVAVANNQQPTGALDVDRNNNDNNNNNGGAAAVQDKQSRPNVVRLAEDVDGNTRRHKSAKLAAAVPSLEGEVVGSRNGGARAVNIPVRTPAHLQRILGVGVVVERGVVIDGNGLGGAAKALVPFAEDNSGGGLSAAEAAFVYSGGSYPFSNLARCSAHMAAASSVVVAGADVARPAVNDAADGAGAVAVEPVVEAQPALCVAGTDISGFVDVADTMDADALALATMHGVMCLHRTISKLQQQRDAACGIAERLLDHFVSASQQLGTKAASV